MYQDDLASDSESVVETDLDTVSLSSVVTSSDSTRVDVGSSADRQQGHTAETSPQVNHLSLRFNGHFFQVDLG